jgi:hypothetical protein
MSSQTDGRLSLKSFAVGDDIRFFKTDADPATDDKSLIFALKNKFTLSEDAEQEFSAHYFMKDSKSMKAQQGFSNYFLKEARKAASSVNQKSEVYYKIDRHRLASCYKFSSIQ